MNSPETTTKTAGLVSRDACGACCEAPAAAPVPDTTLVSDARERSRFRIPTMDCASEESEIRRAVAGIAGIRSMTFQLGERTMVLDAAPAVVEQALAAIRKTGFDPQPVTAAAAAGQPSAEGAEDEHDHAADAGGLRRLGFALALAIGAELVGFLAPDTRLWQGVGLAVAAVAIWMAGIDVYRKGLTALFRGRLPKSRVCD